MRQWGERASEVPPVPACARNNVLTVVGVQLLYGIYEYDRYSPPSVVDLRGLANNGTMVRSGERETGKPG